MDLFDSDTPRQILTHDGDSLYYGPIMSVPEADRMAHGGLGR